MQNTSDSVQNETLKLYKHSESYEKNIFSNSTPQWLDYYN